MRSFCQDHLKQIILFLSHEQLDSATTHLVAPANREAHLLASLGVEAALVLSLGIPPPSRPTPTTPSGAAHARHRSRHFDLLMPLTHACDGSVRGADARRWAGTQAGTRKKKKAGTQAGTQFGEERPKAQKAAVGPFECLGRTIAPIGRQEGYWILGAPFFEQHNLVFSERRKRRGRTGERFLQARISPATWGTLDFPRWRE